MNLAEIEWGNLFANFFPPPTTFPHVSERKVAGCSLREGEEIRMRRRGVSECLVAISPIFCHPKMINEAVRKPEKK